MVSTNRTFSVPLFVGCYLLSLVDIVVAPDVRLSNDADKTTRTTSTQNDTSIASSSTSRPQSYCGDRCCFPLTPPAPELVKEDDDKDDVPPLRFLNACDGDLRKAQKRFANTLKWRRDNHIDTILRESFPNFALIKQHYPHYYHLTGYKGEPVYYEFPAHANLQELQKAAIGLDQLLRHYLMITEYQWQMINRDDLMQSIYVLDLDGIRFQDFVDTTMEFVQRASRTAAEHYPDRAGVIIIVNAPRWFRLIWKVIQPIVPETTLHKIFILGRNEDVLNRLTKHIPIEHIPQIYGGSSSIPLGQSPEEIELANLMEHNLALVQNRQSIPPVCHKWSEHQLGPCRFCNWRPARSY
eukprot:scaffold24419_cov196-Cylindrotheca_fusiformis.AAC.2